MTMKNINLDKYSPFHKTGHTSKGDQRKWEIDGIWYKADYMGYESLAEVLVSRLLKKSSLKYAFVTYDLTKIEYNNSSINACVSQDFRKEGQVLIPLEKLFRQYTGESLAVKLAEFADVRERIRYLVEQVENITGIKKFGKYITEMIEIDAFFLNGDRHTNNIAVLYDEENERTLLDTITEESHFDPEEIMITKEHLGLMEEKMAQSLSRLERNVMSLYLDGQSYVEIAKRLRKSEKSIDNALQRVKRKVEKFLQETAD